MTLKAIFFDLDNTLFPAETIYQSGLRSAWTCLKRSKPLSWPQFQTVYAQARYDVKKRLAPAPAARSRILYFKRLVELVFQRDRPRIALDLIAAYDQCWKEIRPASVRSVARQLAGRFTLGIMTNQMCLMQLQKMNRIDPDGALFPILVTAEELGVEKPHPLMFREACRRARCRPSEALLIGDSWSDDVVGARRAGFQVMYWQPIPDGHKPSRRVSMIRDLRELPKLLGLAAQRAR